MEAKDVKLFKKEQMAVPKQTAFIILLHSECLIDLNVSILAIFTKTVCKP